jgi:hypothetical protein
MKSWNQSIPAFLPAGWVTVPMLGVIFLIEVSLTCNGGLICNGFPQAAYWLTQLE